jgi:2-iminobutanoate/2-iminopropanoate deaminase
VRRDIDTGLPPATAPYTWATMADNILYTVHVPLRADGTAETGSIERQAQVTLGNLKTAVEAAGGTLEDITQVIVYLTRLEDKPAFDRVYAEFFAHRYPNRACIVISALALPETHLEIIAYAHIGPAHS